MSELVNPTVDILTAPRSEPSWLVPDLMLQGTLVCLAGHEGTGKSQTCYSLAMAVAAGMSPLGLFPATEPKRVLYFDQENSLHDRDEYMRRAYMGLIAQNGGADPIFTLATTFWPMHFQLGGEDWVDCAKMIVEQVRPHLMFFDTATPSFNILDENSNAEATKTINGVRYLMSLTDPVSGSVVLRHAKTRSDKGGSVRTMRGAKAWAGASDANLFLVRTAGRRRNDNLSLTRLVKAKSRAFGLKDTVYISPQWTDRTREGLVLTGSFKPSADHKQAREEGVEED